MLSSQAQVLSNGDLTAGYRRGRVGFDELMTPSGAIRPHWQPLLRGARRARSGDPLARMEQLNARVRETGIAYDLFSDPASTAQPWRVDLVPLIFAPEEWRELERALIQRARLFEAMLADLYGPQRLLATGRHSASAGIQRSLLPAALPGSAAAAAATSSSSPPTWRAGPDGRWRVIDTHTETPAGIGYALANRMVHTNVAGDIFGACQAHAAGPVLPAVAGGAGRAAPIAPTRRSRC